MAIRTLDPSISIPSLDNLAPAVQWHTLNCELITPMYGGGVISTKVDEKMPIRASAIRGQLRFWWRLLAKHKWNLGNDKTIRQAEFKLWGGMNDGDADGQAGQVLLKVANAPNENTIRNKLVSYDFYDNDKYSNLKYVLFPAHNETNPDLKPHKLLKADGITWQLQFAFSPTLPQDKQKQVIETLQWWANFGGLGFRSRKGLGAVYVSQSPDYPQIAQRLTETQIQQAGCKLVARQDNSTDAVDTLKTAVEKLRSFRQGCGVGRNYVNGFRNGKSAKIEKRSRWPEPDALRRIYKRHAPNHAPVHPAGNVFARAVFGLPILFDFGASSRQGDPSVKTMLEPSGGERLASPLILRPIYAGERNGQKQWRAAALVLPYEHILEMSVKVDGGEYPIWKQDTAEHIRPIHENGGIDPLQAFLTYFVN